MQLQISTVNVSQLGKNTRLDPEYYSPSNLSLNDQITAINHLVIDDIATVTDGIHTSISFSDTSKVNLISAMSPKDNYLDTSRTGYIDEAQHKANPRTQLKENDIILSTVGTIGNCAVVDESVLPANSDRHVGIIRLKNHEWKPRFISTFLLSKYGRFQTLRESTGNVQLNLFIDKIRTLTIPSASNQLQNTIESLVSDATKKRLESADKLTEANQALITHLGFADFTPSTVNYSSRSSKEANEANRLDSEYWLPMYDEILNIINSYQNGVSQIGKTFKQIKSNFKPEKDSKYKYVEIGDINIAQPDFSFTELMGDELPANAKIKLKHKTLVTSKVRPNRGATAILNDENEYIVSGAFVALQEKEMNLETLYAYLKLEPIKELLLRYNTGTSYPTITDNDVLNLPIPNITADVQSEIQNKVISATELLRDSKRLLEVAKRAVEVFIEQDESAALEYISQNYE